jgi:hypothetical protein
MRPREAKTSLTLSDDLLKELDRMAGPSGTFFYTGMITSAAVCVPGLNFQHTAAEPTLGG